MLLSSSSVAALLAAAAAPAALPALATQVAALLALTRLYVLILEPSTDILVVGVGAINATFGVSGVEEYTWPMKASCQPSSCLCLASPAGGARRLPASSRG